VANAYDPQDFPKHHCIASTNQQPDVTGAVTFADITGGPAVAAVYVKTQLAGVAAPTGDQVELAVPVYVGV
jgi:hypothetical protein